MRKRRYRIKHKGAALLRIGILLGAVLLLAGAVYGIAALAGSNGEGAKAEQLPFTSESNYAFTGSGFLYMYGDRRHYDDLTDAKKDASYQVSTGAVQLAASSGVSVLYHESAVQIVGAAEPLTFSGRVLDVACGSAHVAVLQEETGGGCTLLIYDKTGVQTDQMDFSAGTLLDFGFSQSGGETLWTLEMSVTASQPVSTLTTYNLATNRTTGVMSIQGQLVDRVVFTQNSIFLCCTTNLIRFNRTGNTEAYRLLVYGWELCDVSTAGSSPVMLFRERGALGSEGTVKIYTLPEGDVASASISEAQLPAGTISAFLSGGRLVACTRTEKITYTAAGKQAGTISLPREADALEKLSDDYMLLRSGNGLYTVSLK